MRVSGNAATIKTNTSNSKPKHTKSKPRDPLSVNDLSRIMGVKKTKYRGSIAGTTGETGPNYRDHKKFKTKSKSNSKDRKSDERKKTSTSKKKANNYVHDYFRKM